MATSTVLIYESLFISVAVMLILLFAANHYLKKIPTQNGKDPEKQTKITKCEKRFILIRVLCNESGHYSLSLFQFLIWTMVISFTVLWLSLIRILSGELDVFPFEEFPVALFLLMGLSVIVPVVKTGIDDARKANAGESGKAEVENYSPSMIQYRGSSSLTRFQMLLWTIISAVLYVSVVIMQLVKYNVYADLTSLYIPDVDPILLSLMGLSQAGFIGGAIVAEGKVQKIESESGGDVTSTGVKPVISKPKIEEIKPAKAMAGDKVILIGEGFGQKKGNILINNKLQDLDLINSWESKNIEFKLPQIDPGNYRISVVTDKSSNIMDFTIIPEPGGPPSGIKQKAKIIGDLWSGGPSAKDADYWNREGGNIDEYFYVCYEFDVPEGYGEWGGIFEAKLYIDGLYKAKQSYPPKPYEEGNIGCFFHKFAHPGVYEVEVRGQNSVKKKVTVKEYK